MTQTNLDRYKTDLNKLIKIGDDLLFAMQLDCYPAEIRKQLEEANGGNKKGIEALIKDLPNFLGSYQHWYSESLSLIKQLLPDRFANFVALYEKPKNRKELNYGTYVIADYLQGLVRKNYAGEIIVERSSALPQFKQQLNILKAVQARFESSLFDIKQLVQADLFDSELEAAQELLKMNFGRAAGAIAGVVLERHLQQVCESHSVKLSKKEATISVLNDALKAANVIEVAQWRFIQHLGDLRNLCDHNKEKEPTATQISDLIEGVGKISKTLF